MGLAERVFPLTRVQLDIWLAQRTGHFGAKWQLGLLVRIADLIDPGLFESAIRQVVREAEPLRASFFEVDGVVVNFIPTTHLADLAGSAASGTLTHAGLGDQFGLVFFSDDDQLFLSTAGAGQFFSDCDVCDLAERLERVLVAMAADPGRSSPSVDLLDEGEHAWLEGWGNRAVLTQPAPTPVSIPVLFAAQVARAPEAVGISCGEHSWTYRQLEEAANWLAHLLAAQGVGPGACVGLLLERSAEAVVAILAVLKTGAAYLPIDPALPAARIGFMLADAAPIAAITTTGLRPRLDGCDLLVIDVEDPRIPSYPCTGLPAPAPDDIAYLIYTSGTTGVPKGVAVTHHNVTQLLESLVAGLPPGQVWTQCHSYAFDFSVWEIWGALPIGSPVSGAAMAVFVAPVPLGIGVGGRPLPASSGRNGTVRIWDLHGGDPVGKPLIGHIERSELTRAPPDAA